MRCYLLFILGLFVSLSISAQTLEQGIQLFDEDRIEEAELVFESIRLQNHRNADAHFYLGRVAFEREQYSDAVDWFEQANDLKPDTPLYHLWMGHAFGRQAQSASVLRQAGLARKTKHHYERAIELDPSFIEARSRIIDYYMQAPGILGGGREKAEAQADAIAGLDVVEGILAWEKIYNYGPEWDKLKALYERGIREHPKIQLVYLRLFSLYFNQQQFEEAESVARLHISEMDTSAMAFYNLGNALSRSDNYEKAYAAYQKSLELNPNNFGNFYQIGRLAAVSGNYLEEGKAALASFLEHRDEISSNFLAWAYYRLGTINEHLNELELARVSYQQALDADASLEVAKAALANLD
jgi:tetratricopeptide (TPR) repeat protein